MKIPVFVRSAFNKIAGFRLSKRFSKYLAYSALFSVLFFFFLFLSLPVNRFVPAVESFVSKSLGRTVRIDEIATSFTGAVVVSGLEIGLKEEDAEGDEKLPLQSEGEKAEGEKKSDGAAKSSPALKYFFDEIKVKLGFLSALLGTLDVNAQVAGLGGTMKMSYKGAFPEIGDKAAETSKKNASAGKTSPSRKRKRTAKKAEAKEAGQSDDKNTEDDADDSASDEDGEETPLDFYFKADDINLKLVHDLRTALPVPLSGTLNLEVDLSSPTSALERTSGKISFSMRDLLLSKKGYEATIFGSSLAVPLLSISSIEGEIVFKEGKGQVTSFKVVSKHIDISLEGEIALGDTFKTCKTDLYAAFKIKDGYLDQSEAIRTIMESADTFSSKARHAHRDDGYYGFRYQGFFGKGRFIPTKDFPPSGKKSAKKSSRPSRRKRPSRSRRTTGMPAVKSPAENNTGGQNNAAVAPPPVAASHGRPAAPLNPPAPVENINRPDRVDRVLDHVHSPARPPVNPVRRSPVRRRAGLVVDEEDDGPAEEEAVEEEEAEEEEAEEEEAEEEEAEEDDDRPHHEEAEEEDGPGEEEEAEEEEAEEGDGEHEEDSPPEDEN